mgnify:FL=1
MNSSKILLAISFSVALVFTAATTFGHGVHDESIDPEKVTTRVKKTSDGVRITVTSDDKETVERIQENAAWYKHHSSEGCGHWKGREHGHGRSGHHHGHW